MGLGSEIRDPEKTYSGSRVPDPGVKKAPDPGSGSATLVSSVADPGCLSRIWIFSIRDQPKKLFLSSRVVHPGSDFLPISDPGVKKAPDPGSASATLTVRVRPHEYRMPYGTVPVCLTKNILISVFYAGFRIRIRINLSCWIRIRMQEGKNDPQK